jgi:hypothetical protein
MANDGDMFGSEMVSILILRANGGNITDIYIYVYMYNGI